ncbi:MAG TPA: DNA-processing protein DprA [Chitinophagaceae bacterium]|nr:DNA-processing protein DprA [Chitinophagaceae bacterium]
MNLLYHIALTLVPNIGDVHAKLLLQAYGNDAQKIFEARKGELDKIPGIGSVRAKSIKEFSNFKRAEEELIFIEKYKIETLIIGEEKYPKRLLNCYDAPTLLYYRGNANLNAEKIVSIVGTRNNTEYGKLVTEKLIDEFANHDILIVSGLAYGVDSIAHKLAMKSHLKTVGVLAHSLDRIYPSSHTSMAKEMVEQGGLLTEFISNTKPDKQNFPKRNRIVAGMADATIVIETNIKGGSMITAELANSYNKDVFAIPGKITDGKSEGCNFLIKNNKAMLITHGQDVIEQMQWQDKKKIKPKPQRELFIQLTPDEEIIYKIIKEHSPIHIDELYLKSGLSSSHVAAAILNLELQGIITQLPGKLYKLM